jgi:hypothetical protein
MIACLTVALPRAQRQHAEHGATLVAPLDRLAVTQEVVQCPTAV